MAGVAIFQPPFFGAAYLAARARQADFVILSGTDQTTAKSPDMQGRPQKTGQVHTRIADGWLNLPTASKLRPIDETPLAIDAAWIRKTMRRLDYLYRTEAWDTHRASVESLFAEGIGGMLGDFNVSLFSWAIRVLGIDRPIMRDYEVAERCDDKDDTALALVVASGASHYICGEPSAAYMDKDKCSRFGVEIVTQNWQPPSGVDGAASLLHLIARGDAI